MQIFKKKKKKKKSMTWGRKVEGKCSRFQKTQEMRKLDAM